MNKNALNYVLNEILSNALELSESPKQFADYLSEQIRKIIGAKAVVICVSKHLEQYQILSVFPKRKKSWVEQLPIESFLKMAPNKIQYFEKKTLFKKLLSKNERAPVDDVIVIPLIAGPQQVGSILLIDILDSKGIDSILDLLENLSGVFALIIRNSHLYSNMEELVEERTIELQNSNEALLQRENELVEAIKRTETIEAQSRDILLTAMDAFWILDVNGKFIEVNNIGCDMVGYTKAELLHMNISDIEAIETDLVVKAKLQKIIKIGELRFESKHKRKDGEIIDVEVSCKWRASQNDFVVFVHNITNRKLFEDQLKQQQYYLKKAQEIGQIGTWELNIKTGELKWTEENYKIFGIPLGTPITLDLFFSFVHPDDREFVSEKWNEAIKQKPYDIEHRILVNDQLKWVREKSEIEFDSNGEAITGIGFTQDITAKKIAEFQIVKNEKSLVDLLNNLKAGVVVHAADSSIIRVNPRACELLGLSEEKLKGKIALDPSWNFLHHDGSVMQQAEFPINRILSTKTQIENYELGVFRPNTKDIVWLFVNGIPIFDFQNEIVEVIINFVDITERRKIEQDLITAKLKAEESDQLKTGFLQNMSHEIRTPLNSIMGFASLLPDEEDKKSIDKYSDIIYKNSEQLLHVIDDIVLFSKLQNKQMELDLNEVDMIEVLKGIKNSYELPEYQHSVQLLVETANESKIIFISDSEKIWHIFTNLISNAFKYTAKGFIRFGIKNENAQWICFVSDTGIGIPENEKDKIFERFYRGSNFNHGAISGTGLGLSIVQELIDLLSGTIWIESEIGKGTTFKFSLPSMII